MVRKTIGIIGGMGPEATVDFMSKVLDATPAKTDQEHIRMLVDCNPQVPCRVKAILENGPSSGVVMAKMAKNLEAWGADLLVIPCNTAHYYLDDVQAAVALPVIDMIGETARVLFENGVRRAVLLATSALVKTGLYAQKMAAKGIDILLPDSSLQAKVMDIIFAVKAKEHDKARAGLQEVLSFFENQGVDSAILACTELPLAAKGLSTGMKLKLYDPGEILAQEAVKRALAES